MTLELYEAADDDDEDYYFRAIYNGESLRMEGCAEIADGDTGLCAASIVMDKTLGYAQENGGALCRQPVSSAEEVL